MPNVSEIEKKIVAIIHDTADATKLPQDPETLLATAIGELPLDSLDLLTLAMKLEDYIGRVVEVEEFDPTISVSDLALKLGAPIE